MADDARLAELRGLMAEALRATGVWWSEDTDGPTDRLLPVVSAWAEQHAARRAAEAVRWLARSWEGTELAADLDGRMRAYRLHVADAVIAVLSGERP